jgi:rSAM/selenodomain-associated transferase 2
MRLSIIIPTLNEAAHIDDVIAHTRALGDCEILVVDGGSTDGTLERAAAADRVLVAGRGRALQMNAGAAASAGDVLLFLHADCRLEAGAFDAIAAAVTDPRTVGGCFRQTIDAAGWRYRLLEWGNALRVRALRWAYGDQGIFVRRLVFEELGGFPPVPLMEDLLFMKRLKRRGRIRLLDARLHVSARRWRQAGLVRRTLHNWALIAALHAGVSPERLARFYPPVRSD